MRRVESLARKSNLANAKFDNLSLFDNVKEHVTESEGQLWLEYCPVEGFECEGTCCLPSTCTALARSGIPHPVRCIAAMITCGGLHSTTSGAVEPYKALGLQVTRHCEKHHDPKGNRSHKVGSIGTPPGQGRHVPQPVEEQFTKQELVLMDRLMAAHKIRAGRPRVPWAQWEALFRKKSQQDNSGVRARTKTELKSKYDTLKSRKKVQHFRKKQRRARSSSS